MSLTESADLELGPLALLHQEARRSVFKDLRKTVGDRTALSALQCLVGLVPSKAGTRCCGGTRVPPPTTWNLAECLTPVDRVTPQLQDLSCGGTLKEAAFDGELSGSQSELVWAILGGLREDGPTSSAHLLVSALEGDSKSFPLFFFFE